MSESIVFHRVSDTNLPTEQGLTAKQVFFSGGHDPSTHVRGARSVIDVGEAFLGVSLSLSLSLDMLDFRQHNELVATFGRLLPQCFSALEQNIASLVLLPPVFAHKSVAILQFSAKACLSVVLACTRGGATFCSSQLAMALGPHCRSPLAASLFLAIRTFPANLFEGQNPASSTASAATMLRTPSPV